MSGTSGEAPCPKCGSNMQTYIDWKPIDWVDGSCLECGFYYTTKEGIMTDDELESERLEMDWEDDTENKMYDDSGKLWRSYYEPDNV